MYISIKQDPLLRLFSDDKRTCAISQNKYIFLTLFVHNLPDISFKGEGNFVRSVFPIKY